MSNRKAAILVLATSGTLGLSAAPAAHAQEEAPAARMALSVAEKGTGHSRSAADLNCHPHGGSHPDSGAACASLDEVDGDFSKLPTRDGACTMERDPVTVTAKGTWRDRPVDYRETFSNPCLAAQETDGVYALERPRGR